MDCDAVKENLALYVYDELPRSERDAADEHLAGCERCRLALGEARRMQELMSAGPALGPTPELLVRCRQHLEDSLDREQLGWTGLIRKWLPGFALTQPFRAAAALTLVALGFSLGWIVRPRTIKDGIGPRNIVGSSVAGTDLGGAQISDITQVSPDPQTGQVKITLNAARQVTLEGSLDDPHIQQVLLYAVRSYDNPGIRLDTLDALRSGSSNPTVQAALLYAMRHDQNAGVRVAALNSVPRMPWCEEVRGALVDAAQHDDNLGVRDEAIDQLVAHAVAAGDQSLVPVLENLAANDSDRYVRMKSARALRRLGQEP
ncbi:MAG TPA: zf-HC2 domain-containing protein [Terriglobia bacterium]|nr:zf-HC2 domain-containing protein [Terriglobia bacterium]